MSTDPESRRLDEARANGVAWRMWGPYLSERQWGTVREDYSHTGAAWDYFTHDHARSRAYAWGEDGLAGLCDEKQRICFALALWNGADPILKERLFGLTNSEGNHGEDVKEYYFYLDSTPTHSYMKWLYKYPHRAYPYADLVETNRRRSRRELEYELVDTGIFDDDRYFDVFVEYAKAAPDDILVHISVVNRGPEPATIHLLPTLWFRRTWSATGGDPKPSVRQSGDPGEAAVVVAWHPDLGKRWLACDRAVPLLYTENETNRQRIFGEPSQSPYVKDGIDGFVVHGKKEAVNPACDGTKVAAHYVLTIDPGATSVVKLRLRDTAPSMSNPLGSDHDEVFAARRREADQYYDAITPPAASDDERRVFRQALAGMLWSKQHYALAQDAWLAGHGANPLLDVGPPTVRNSEWFHLVNDDVISMPDKWEYPWYAAWDLAFHCVALSAVDIDFAKQQLELMVHDLYMHPNGQIPAYEWNFGDVNPPVHAWATYYVYLTEKEMRGRGDHDFLRRAFHGLMLNFNWWVNRKDRNGKNVFEGGFLGLDNIGVFDRSRPLPTGGWLEQADGTAWMVLFAQNMLEIALELAQTDPIYEEAALKYLEHYFWIAAAMDRVGANNDEMWDETDGFFYDVLRLPDRSATRLRVRSLVGLLPLAASTVVESDVLVRFPKLLERARRFLRYHYELTANIAAPERPGVGGRRLLSVLSEVKLRRILARMLDESEFLSPYGIRAVSRHHLEHPFVFTVHGEEHRVDYEPAESSTGLFGGNSNWRGPIWMPVNALLVRALVQLYSYYGDAFTIECPTGSGRQMNLFEVGREIAARLTRIFLRDASGRRPVFGACTKFQTDPHWRDHLLFYEYFHGDNGAGIGASHQTGWTGVVAKLIQFFGTTRPGEILSVGPKRLIAPDSAA